MPFLPALPHTQKRPAIPRRQFKQAGFLASVLSGYRPLLPSPGSGLLGYGAMMPPCSVGNLRDVVQAVPYARWKSGRSKAAGNYRGRA